MAQSKVAKKTSSIRMPVRATKKPLKRPLSPMKKLERARKSVPASPATKRVIKKAAKTESTVIALKKMTNGEDTLNNTTFWDAIAHEYDEEILSSCHENKRCSVRNAFQKYGNKGHICADFGCGVGKYLPALSKHFKFVVGMDFSKGLLERARVVAGKLKNVEILPAMSLTETQKVDHAIKTTVKKGAPVTAAPLVDFGICTNVLLSPDINVQMGILQTIYAALKPGGHLLLLVPSYESHLWGTWAVLQGPGSACKVLTKEVKTYNDKTVAKEDVLHGVVYRGDEQVRTQHFIKEQIQAMVEQVGFQVLWTDKSEYQWNTEIDFGIVPDKKESKKMEHNFSKLNSGPWDWILMLEKKK